MTKSEFGEKNIEDAARNTNDQLKGKRNKVCVHVRISFRC